MRMTKRRWLAGLALLLIVACGLTYVFNFTTLSTWVYGMGDGSPKDAHKWRDRFQAIPDPETARNRYSEIHVKQFENGEWIFGICTDSHSSHRGGTVVVKDSRGAIRAYFGHVCGRYFIDGLFTKSNSLDDFYTCSAWETFYFKEYKFP
jgi:hypothetical protein